MRFLPESLFGRTLAVLVVGLFVTHFASTAIHYSDRGDVAALVGGGHVAERLAMVVRLVEEAPPRERPWVVHAASRPGFHLSWDSEPKVAANADSGLRERITAAMLALSLDGAADREVRIAPVPRSDSAGGAEWQPRRPGPPGGPGMGQMMRYHMQMMNGETGAPNSLLRVSVGLSDGFWLNLTTYAPAQPPFWTASLVLSIVVMTLSVVLLSGWAVRRMTVPLETIAQAADRLGRDMNAPPLPERGASEVRRAARAFNHMQQRISGLLNARTRMLAAISHDLRTPITRLRLRAEFIEDEEQREKTMADLAEMEEMVASVLSFARDDAAEERREAVDMAALLHSVCDDSADAGRDCRVVSAERVVYDCRPLALRRALTNLVGNAVTYGVCARVSVRSEGRHVVIRVDDDGPGIPEEELGRVFEPFYRLERSRSRETGGTGIGLCIVQSVAQAHGGAVRLGNRPEGGLRAELLLPL